MKKNLLTLFIFLFTLSVFAQESDSTLTEMKEELKNNSIT